MHRTLIALALVACSGDPVPRPLGGSFGGGGAAPTADGQADTGADGGGDKAPIFQVFRVVPQWVVRAERQEAGYTACEARAFDQEQETALGLRLDGDGGFAVTLLSPDTLLAPGFSRPNEVTVAVPYGESWQFASTMEGGVERVRFVPDDGFGLAYALTRGWQVEIKIGTLDLNYRLRGVADAITLLGQCVRLFINPALDLPPIPPPEPSDS